MKVVVLGATGTTGQLVITDALAKGYEVIAFVRRPDVLQERDGLTIIQGSIDNQIEMQKCFSGSDAVISCLGVRPSFRSLRHGSNLQRRTLPKIVAAINDAGVKRFILMSSFGSGETRKKSALFIKVVLYSFIAKKMFDDKAIAEQSLSQCKANWTAVYPVTLSKSSAIPESELVSLEKVRKVPGIPRLPFANVARSLVNLIQEENQAGQKLLLTIPGCWRQYNTKKCT